MQTSDDEEVGATRAILADVGAPQLYENLLADEVLPEMLRRDLDRIHVGTFAGPAGTFQQRTELTRTQRDILKALQIDAPPRVYQLKLPAKP